MRRWSAVVGVVAPMVSSASPLMFHQGRALNAAGEPIDGTHRVDVSLDTAASGGTSVWSEAHLSVPFEDGYYGISLGGITPIDPALFAGDRWLSVRVDNQPVGSQPVAATPWAIRAAQADVATGVELIGEAGGTGLACPAGDVGRLRFNTDLNALEFCRSVSGSPQWFPVALAVRIVGDDTTGRSYSDATYAANCQAYRNHTSWAPAIGDGVYWINTSGGPLKVWCDMTTESQGWLDVVKTFHATGQTASALAPKFFTVPSGVTLTAAAATNASSVPGVLLTSNQAASHQQAFWLQPAVSFTSVRLGYRMQGTEGANRCSTSSWIPLNGPGFNGGSTDYAASCPSGMTCIQGTQENGRDAPIAVDPYVNDSITATTVLTWSGSNSDGNSVGGCARDNNIPSTQPALFVTKLLIR